MSGTTQGSARELGDYGSLLRRRWAWLAAGILLGLAAALGYLQLATPTYVSTAKVLVLPTSSDTSSVGDRTSGAINLDTEAQLVTSAAVATRASEILGTSLTPVALANRVEITVPPNTTLLNIAFRANTPPAAQAGAQAFAQAYLDNRQETAQATIDDEVAALETQIAGTTSQLQDVIRAVNSRSDPPTATEEAVLSARQQTYTAQLTSLQTQLAPLAAVPQAGIISNEAQTPSTPTDPNPMLVLPSGAMAGLLLGLGMAVVRERTDRRVHSGADLERLFNLPVLAQLKPRRGQLSSLSLSGRLDHDLRGLFHSVAAAGEGASQVVLVASLRAPQPADQIARPLCLIAARSGVRATYVTRLAGAETMLVAAWRRNGARGDLNVTSYADHGVVTQGELWPTTLASHIERLRRDRDVVVLAMPTGDPKIDLPVLTRHVDVVLLAVELGRATRSSIAEALAIILRSGRSVPVFAVTIRSGGRRREPEVQLPDAGVDLLDRPVQGPNGTDSPRAAAPARRSQSPSA